MSLDLYHFLPGAVKTLTFGLALQSIKRMGWTEVLVNSKALVSNLESVRKRVTGKLYAVVKSNAYGHGLLQCSRLFMDEGADALACFSTMEALTLKKAGIDVEVLLLGGFLPGEEGYVFEGGFTPVVSDWWMLNALEREGQARKKSVGVHVKLDTGMGRLGFVPGQWERLKQSLKKYRWVQCVGITSHFPVADEFDDESVSFTKKQIAVFKEAVDFFRDVGVEVAHLANSAGVFFYPEASFDGARVGIALYGGLRHPELRQAMSVRTKLLSVKEVPAGWSISYGRTYVTPAPKRVGIIPCGYATGFLRSLSHKAQVLVNGKRASVLGRVCMDLTVIDLDGVEAKEGDWVYLLGGEPNAISVFECAEWMGTITYEVFCLFSMGASSFLFL